MSTAPEKIREEVAGAELLAQVEGHFGNLSSVERTVLRATTCGKEAGGPSSGSTGEGVACLPASNVMRSEILRWVLTHPNCRTLLDPRGVHLSAIRMIGLLDLNFASIEMPLFMHDCQLADGLTLNDAKLRALRLSKCLVKGMRAVRCKIDGPLHLLDLTVAGELDLRAIEVAGHLRLTGTQLDNPEGQAIVLDDAVINGSLVMNGGFRAAGAVRLYGIDIHRNIECDGVINAGRLPAALMLENCRVGGAVLLRHGFRALGTVRVFEASIALALDFDGARLASRTGPALHVEASKIGSALNLRGRKNAPAPRQDFFRCLGGLLIYKCAVQGNVHLRLARIRTKKRDALALPDNRFEGRLTVDESHVVGISILARTSVRIDVGFRASTLEGVDDACLRARGLAVGGTLSMQDGFKALGAVHLSGIDVGDRLSIYKSEFLPSGRSSGLNLSESRIRNAAAFSDGRLVGNLDLTNAAIGRLLDLSRSEVVGRVVLSGAHIAGQLLMERLQCLNPKGDAMTAYIFRCDGTVNAKYLHCEGRTVFYGGAIEGDMLFQNAQLGGPLMLARLRVGGHIVLSKARFESSGTDLSIDADSLNCGGSVLSESGFTASGRISFNSAQVGGTLDLTGCRISGPPDRPALSTLATKVGVDFNLRQARIEGRVIADRATIGGRLDVRGGRIRTIGGPALSANGMNVAGDVTFGDGFQAKGSIELQHSTLGGNVTFRNACVSTSRGFAVSLARARIAGDLDLAYAFEVRSLRHAATFRGGVDFSHAHIAGNVDLTNAHLLRRTGMSLQADRLVIEGTLFMDASNFNGEVDLSHSRLGTLSDNATRWTRASAINLSGLVYKTLSPLDVDDRLDWLESASRSVYHTQWMAARGEESFVEMDRHSAAGWQPYEHLAQTLKDQGRELEARRVAIAKQNEIGRRAGRRTAWGLLHWFYGMSIRYGYRPQNALWFAPIPLVVLTLAFLTGADALMVPTTDTALKFWQQHPTAERRARTPEGYPQFNALAYSLDALVPGLNLKQKDSWRPDANAECRYGPESCGKLLTWYLWIHTLLGALIAVFAAAGFAGLVRKS